MSLALARPLFALLQEDFDALTDPRVERTRLHKLSDILLLALAAFCSGAETFEDIPVWSLAYGVENLQSLLGVRLDHGIPHHDTFRRVLHRLEPTCLENSFHTLRKRLPQAEGEDIAPSKHLALDGKEIRASHNAKSNTPAVLLLSVLATDLNLVIAQKKVDGKTNEIPTAQEVLGTLALQGATVTADALHCQRATAETIREGGADYVLAVKENQKGLQEALQTLFRLNREEERVPMERFVQEEAGHGRQERRVGYRILVEDWLPAGDPLRVWRDWVSVLCLESERTWRHRGEEKRSVSVRYFISSSGEGVERLMGFVRSHWSIENRLHWVMDVTFGEDACRVRSGEGAENLATLRRLASFLLKSTEPAEKKGMSLRQRKKLAGWKPDYLQQVLINKN